MIAGWRFAMIFARPPPTAAFCRPTRRPLCRCALGARRLGWINVNPRPFPSCSCACPWQISPPWPTPDLRRVNRIDLPPEVVFMESCVAESPGMFACTGGRVEKTLGGIMRRYRGQNPRIPRTYRAGLGAGAAAAEGVDPDAKPHASSVVTSRSALSRAGPGPNRGKAS